MLKQIEQLSKNVVVGLTCLLTAVGVSVAGPGGMASVGGVQVQSSPTIENGEAGVAQYSGSENNVVVYRDSSNQIRAMYINDETKSVLKADSLVDSLDVGRSGDDGSGSTTGPNTTINSNMTPVIMD